MNIKISPAKLSGTIAAISSKSYAHRLLVSCALADTATTVQLNVFSQDILAAVNALKSLGANIQTGEDSITITPITRVNNPTVNCGESGTVARFLLPVAAALGNGGTLTGEGSLLARPFAPLCGALAEHGVSCSDDKLPITFEGKLQPGVYRLRGDQSSQYISGLMFALPLLDGDSVIQLTTPLESSGYLDMTMSVLSEFGITIEQNGNTYAISGNQRYKSPGSITVEGDWSNAAFWLAAGVRVSGLDEASLQKDKTFIQLKDSTEIDASQIPDLVPVLSVAAAARNTTTRIYNVQRLRYKESDRIKSTADMLTALGCKVDILDNELLIHGGKFRGGTVHSANDHRIVMAAAIASCFCQGDVIITDAHAVSKTYPEFFSDFNMLGGKAVVI